MSRKITINKKSYMALPFDFNLMVELEDMGVNIEDINSKPLKFAREYFALCAGIDKIEAGMEIQKHIIAGGSIDPIANAMKAEIEKSDFFLSLSKREETETQES